MADLPILFSTPMVRALLREIEQPGTGKTQTRRVLDAACDEPVAIVDNGVITAFNENDLPYRWPRTNAIGDKLWVREAWRTECRAYDDLSPSEMGGEETVIFEADTDWKLNKTVGRLRQGMHMPRWASRITLIVTDVRVQRFQEISEADAKAEGIQQFGRFYAVEGDDDWDDARVSAVAAFAHLWDGLNAARVYGWDVNPWVAAYTFRPILGNIDQVRP